MISLLKQYKRSLFLFISGLVMAVIVSLGISHQQPVTAASSPDSALTSEIVASHQECNFYDPNCIQ